MSPLGEQDLRIQNLRPGEEVHAAQDQAGLRLDGIDDLVERFLVEAERRRSSTHAHGTALNRRHRIDSNGYRHRHLAAPGDRRDTRDFFERLHMDFTDPLRDDPIELLLALARSGEQDPAGGAASCQCNQELGGGRNFQPGALIDQDLTTAGFGLALME